MRRAILTVATALTLGAASLTPAAAISSYNATPAPERTETGALLMLADTDGDGAADFFDWICTGAMVDDDTFLTAAHCQASAPEGARWFVSLDQDVQAHIDATKTMTADQRAAYFQEQGWVVEGDMHADPAFPGPTGDPHDIAVVDFASRTTDPQDVWDFTPATLPTAGFLSSFSTKELAAATWTVVGYGVQESTPGTGNKEHLGGGVRMQATEGFTTLTKHWAKLAMNESRGFGGACYGDSGGPNFLTVGGATYLVSTTITGDAPCKATNTTYRLDTQVAREFLAPYVTLP